MYRNRCGGVLKIGKVCRWDCKIQHIFTSFYKNKSYEIIMCQHFLTMHRNSGPKKLCHLLGKD